MPYLNYGKTDLKDISKYLLFLSIQDDTLQLIRNLLMKKKFFSDLYYKNICA